MPTYDYVCEKCGFKYEKFQKMTELPDSVCPKCHGKVRRLIGTGASILFKGSGFYETDYKKSSHSHNSDKSSTGTNGTTDTSSKSTTPTDSTSSKSEGST